MNRIDGASAEVDRRIKRAVVSLLVSYDGEVSREAICSAAAGEEVEVVKIEG